MIKNNNGKNRRLAKVKKISLDDEIESTESNYRLLYDFEKKPFIKNAFLDESKTKKFLRYPIAYLFPQAIYYFLTGDFKRGRRYFSLFWQYYPNPKFSFFSLRVIAIWCIVLFRQYKRNSTIRGRKVFS